MKLERIFRSVLRLIPAFTLISVAGCLIGYFVFHIPHGELGVVVSVPTVVAFILTRLLILFVPREIPDETERANLSRLISASIVFICLATTVVMVPSSLIYGVIGLSVIAKGSFFIAALAFLAALVVVFFDITLTVCAALPLRDLMDFLMYKTVEFFWDALRAPTTISIRVFGHYGNPMSNFR